MSTTTSEQRQPIICSHVSLLSSLLAFLLVQLSQEAEFFKDALEVDIRAAKSAVKRALAEAEQEDLGAVAPVGALSASRGASDF